MRASRAKVGGSSMNSTAASARGKPPYHRHSPYEENPDAPGGARKIVVPSEIANDFSVFLDGASASPRR
jgi:hypothetical protein